MKLTYFQGDPPNFGDELNATIWHRLLPAGFFDDDESTLFLGIGSIIQHIHPDRSKKLAVGSGCGGYTRKPDIGDGSWDIRFVRGPRTAEALGLDPSLAVADSAILLRATDLPASAAGIGTAFIPHYESLERGNWQHVCELAGIHFIDPTAPTETVLAEIRGADLVICEAMHGAIVSDALRTPWIGVKTMHHVHRYKWFDFVRSLDLDYRPHALWPSNGREGWALTTGRSGSGARARALLESSAASPVNLGLAYMAARSLQRLSKKPPSLSSDAAIERATERALDAVDRIARDFTTQPLRA